jgi:hypothetical protein
MGVMAEESEPIPPHEDSFPASEIRRTERRAYILRHAPTDAVGAEFGVFRGHFAEVLVRELQPRRLFLVDPWTSCGEYFDWGDTDPYTNYNKLTTLQARKDTEKRMGSSPCAQVIEATLQDFCRDFPGKLDWVYLDTSHSYTDTLHELHLLAPVVSHQGVIMGDDWDCLGYTPKRGVRSAVNEFVRLTNFEIIEAGPEGQFALRRGPRWGYSRRNGLPNDGIVPAALYTIRRLMTRLSSV